MDEERDTYHSNEDENDTSIIRDSRLQGQIIAKTCLDSWSHGGDGITKIVGHTAKGATDAWVRADHLQDVADRADGSAVAKFEKEGSRCKILPRCWQDKGWEQGSQGNGKAERHPFGAVSSQVPAYKTT